MLQATIKGTNTKGKEQVGPHGKKKMNTRQVPIRRNGRGAPVAGIPSSIRMYIHIYVEGGPLAPTCMGSALSGVRGAQPKFYKRKLFRFPIVDYFCKSRYVGFFYIFRNSVYPTVYSFRPNKIQF